MKLTRNAKLFIGIAAIVIVVYMAFLSSSITTDEVAKVNRFVD